MQRDQSAFKIEAAADMVVEALPPLEQHPGLFIRHTLLPEYGLTVSEAARRIGVDRAGFTGVLDGKYSVSRDLAYKLGALMNDPVADLLIAYQHAYDLAQERERREAFKAKIERVEPVEAAAC